MGWNEKLPGWKCEECGKENSDFWLICSNLYCENIAPTKVIERFKNRQNEILPIKEELK